MALSKCINLLVRGMYVKVHLFIYRRKQLLWHVKVFVVFIFVYLPLRSAYVETLFIYFSIPNMS